MNKATILGVCILSIFYTETIGQNFVRIDDDGRRFMLDIGLGTGLLKAGSAYSIKPLFLYKPNLGMQLYVAPHYIVSNRLTAGLRLGGIFRPTFEDQESNSIIQKKFTSYGLLYTEYYLTSLQILDNKPRFYVGLQVGASYIGKMEAKSLVTSETYYLRRRDRDVFLTVAPKIGVAFSQFKLEIEHIVTTPFNPDFTAINFISTLPIGKPRYY